MSRTQTVCLVCAIATVTSTSTQCDIKAAWGAQHCSPASFAERAIEAVQYKMQQAKSVTQSVMSALKKDVRVVTQQYAMKKVKVDKVMQMDARINHMPLSKLDPSNYGLGHDPMLQPANARKGADIINCKRIIKVANEILAQIEGAPTSTAQHSTRRRLHIKIDSSMLAASSPGPGSGSAPAPLPVAFSVPAPAPIPAFADHAPMPMPVDSGSSNARAGDDTGVLSKLVGLFARETKEEDSLGNDVEQSDVTEQVDEKLMGVLKKDIAKLAAERHAMLSREHRAEQKAEAEEALKISNRTPLANAIVRLAGARKMLKIVLEPLLRKIKPLADIAHKSLFMLAHSKIFNMKAHVDAVCTCSGEEDIDGMGWMCGSWKGKLSAEAGHRKWCYTTPQCTQARKGNHDKRGRQLIFAPCDKITQFAHVWPAGQRMAQVLAFFVDTQRLLNQLQGLPVQIEGQENAVRQRIAAQIALLRSVEQDPPARMLRKVLQRDFSFATLRAELEHEKSMLARTSELVNRTESALQHPGFGFKSCISADGKHMLDGNDCDRQQLRIKEHLRKMSKPKMNPYDALKHGTDGELVVGAKTQSAAARLAAAQEEEKLCKCSGKENEKSMGWECHNWPYPAKRSNVHWCNVDPQCPRSTQDPEHLHFFWALCGPSLDHSTGTTTSTVVSKKVMTTTAAAAAAVQATTSTVAMVSTASTTATTPTAVTATTTTMVTATAATTHVPTAQPTASPTTRTPTHRPTPRPTQTPTMHPTPLPTPARPTPMPTPSPCACTGQRHQGMGNACAVWGADPEPWCWVGNMCDDAHKLGAYHWKHCDETEQQMASARVPPAHATVPRQTGFTAKDDALLRQLQLKLKLIQHGNTANSSESRAHRRRHEGHRNSDESSSSHSDGDDQQCAYLCSAHRCVSQADARRPECAACAACQMRPNSRRLRAQALVQAKVPRVTSFHFSFSLHGVVSLSPALAYISGLVTSFIMWDFILAAKVQ